MKNISKENLKKRLQFFQSIFVVLMIIALFTKFYFVAFSYGMTSIIFYSFSKSFSRLKNDY